MPCHRLSYICTALPCHRLTHKCTALPCHRLTHKCTALPCHRLSHICTALPCHRLTHKCTAMPCHRLTYSCTAMPWHRQVSADGASEKTQGYLRMADAAASGWVEPIIFNQKSQKLKLDRIYINPGLYLHLCFYILYYAYTRLICICIAACACRQHALGLTGSMMGRHPPF